MKEMTQSIKRSSWVLPALVLGVGFLALASYPQKVDSKMSPPSINTLQ